MFDSDSPAFPDTGPGLLFWDAEVAKWHRERRTRLWHCSIGPGGGGGLFPDSDDPGLSAGVCSDVARPPGSEGLAGCVYIQGRELPVSRHFVIDQ